MKIKSDIRIRLLNIGPLLSKLQCFISPYFVKCKIFIIGTCAEQAHYRCLYIYRQY